MISSVMPSSGFVLVFDGETRYLERPCAYLGCVGGEWVHLDVHDETGVLDDPRLDESFLGVRHESESLSRWVQRSGLPWPHPGTRLEFEASDG